MSRHGFGKYDPLTAYLTGLDKDRLTLTLAEIEQIIGQALPRTARARGWWVNTTGMRQPRSWLTAGWLAIASALQEGSEAVTFARQPAVPLRTPLDVC